MIFCLFILLLLLLPLLLILKFLNIPFYKPLPFKPQPYPLNTITITIIREKTEERVLFYCGRTGAAVCVSASFERTQQKPSRLFRLPQSVDVVLFNVETELIKVSKISRKHNFVTKREDLGELESLI